MIFSHNRNTLRKFYQESWVKLQDKQNLNPLEMQVIEVINDHPEYKDVILNKPLDQEWFPEAGEENPFLHLGLHIALREQLMTDKPDGIRNIAKNLLTKYEAHQVEHKMMDCILEALWQNQANDFSKPDLRAYIECTRRIC